MKAILIIPESEARKAKRSRLTWTATHAFCARYGPGVMVYANGEILDGENFRGLRDTLGATIETDFPEKACRALGLPAGEPGIIERGA